MSDPQRAPGAPLNLGLMRRLWAALGRLSGPKYGTYRCGRQTNPNRDAEGVTYGYIQLGTLPGVHTYLLITGRIHSLRL